MKKIFRFPTVAKMTLAVGLAVGASGCSLWHSHKEPPPPQLSDAEMRKQADKLYRQARALLDSGDYSIAAKRYDAIIVRFPFTEYGTQAEMEKILALYKDNQFDDADSDADRFLRDHPRHPHADYVQYLKGLIDSGRDVGLLALLGFEDPKADVSDSRNAFNDFALLTQKYPHSTYLGDTRLRMLALRNHIADHELSIVQYYMKRRAWVAAANRAQSIVTDYPGAPATAEALKLMQKAYLAVGLKDQAAEVRQLLAANPGLLAKPVPAKSRSVVRLTARAAPEPPPIGDQMTAMSVPGVSLDDPAIVAAP